MHRIVKLGLAEVAIEQRGVQGAWQRCWSGQVCHPLIFNSNEEGIEKRNKYFDWVINRLEARRPLFFNRGNILYNALLFDLEAGGVAVIEEIIRGLSENISYEEVCALVSQLNNFLMKWG